MRETFNMPCDSSFSQWAEQSAREFVISSVDEIRAT